MNTTFPKIQRLLVLLTVFLSPIVVLPLFAQPFDIAKLSFLSFGVLGILLLLAIQTLLTGRLKIGTSKFDLPLLVLLLATALSLWLKTPNKMEGLLFPGTATLIIGLVILYFLINSVFGSSKKTLISAVFISGIVVSLVSLLAYTGILAKISQLPDFIRNASFSLVGGRFPEALFLGILIPIGVSLLLSEKESVKKVFWVVSLAILILAFAVSFYNVLPGKPSSPVMSDFQSSWVVSIETLKESPILGVGPGNYLTAFNRFRPLTYNATDLWSLRFTSGRSLVFSLITELGLLGFAAFILVLWQITRDFKKLLVVKENPFGLGKAVFASLVISTLFLVLFPANIALIALFVILLAASAKVEEITLNLSAPLAKEGAANTSKLPALVISLPVIALILVFGYFATRALGAEATYKKSVDALSKNDGRATYDALRQAINQNPYVDRYHASYAQVNLALARNIAEKEDITDDDRNTVAQLIQQAIREGKATITLNPARAGSWELLARTYQLIMPFAEGADAFAIESFNQAVALDPINPNLRIALGGVYYALGRYDDAVKTFELAVLSKPDLANAHYNLAVAYREKGEIDNAIAQINAVLSLVEKDSKDYEVAKAELDSLEKKKPAKGTSEGENLTPPAEAEKSTIEPPIPLPEEAIPPTSNQ